MAKLSERYPTDNIIPHTELLGIAYARLNKVFRQRKLNAPVETNDPFLAIWEDICREAGWKPLDLASAKVNKLFSMCIGLLVQDVLGASTSCFVSTGASNSEGLPDLMPRDSKTNIAGEVKKTNNTEKGSHRKRTFEQLANLIDSNDNITKALYVSITGLKPEESGKPWRVHGMKIREDICAVNGETAFKLAFGIEDAFQHFIETLPMLFKDLIAIINEEVAKENLGEILFHYRGTNCAHMLFDPETHKCLVKKGSELSVISPHCENDAILLAQRQNAKIQTSFENGRVVQTLLEDFECSSPSAAVKFVVGSQMSGNKYWVDDNGKTLGEYIKGE